MTGADRAPAAVRALAKNGLYAARNLAGSHRSTRHLLRLGGGFGQQLTGRGTNVCIEGFARSANTFAFYAFKRSNPDVRIAHHLHVPVQVLRAADLGVPCAVLIRRPLDALASVAIVDAGLSPTLCVRSYVNFYERTWHLRGRVAVCDFSEVTDDPGIVAERLNARFGTSFKREQLSEEQRQKLFDDMAEGNQLRGKPETLVPVPTPEKDRLKAEVRDRLAAHPLHPKAERLYEGWLAAR